MTTRSATRSVSDVMAQIVTRPSASPRWTRCALAPTLAAEAGERPASDPAREGTCAAWVAETVLSGRAASCDDMIGQCHENGWEVDDEMARLVQEYVDLCRTRTGERYVEKRVTLAPGIEGTLDWGALDDDGTLYLDDLKYGYRPVKPDSPQLVIYAGGLLNELGDRVKRIVTGIYQPRAFVSGGPHLTREWTVDEIRAQCAWIIERAEDCRGPNPTATPGTHCRDCDGAHLCDALQATAAQIVATVQDTEYGDPDAATLARRLEFFRWAADVVKSAADATESEAIARHRAGDTLPGWGLKERMGQTRVTATRREIKALTGVDIPAPEPPVKVGDLRKAKLTDSQIGLFTTRPSIGWKLEPLDRETLARQFKGVS